MEQLINILEHSRRPAASNAMEAVFLSLLLAFILGQLIAWTYTRTHSGLSYSRTFTQSLVLLTLIVSLVMLVIGNNIVTAFGLLGALAIVRFRNVLKDTRDTAFVFLSLVVGMAVGSEKYLTAICGTMAVTLVVAYLHFTAFGSAGRFDGHLTFLAPTLGKKDSGAHGVVSRFCRAAHTVSVRQSGSDDDSEYVLQVRLRDRGRSQELLDELRREQGVRNVSLMLRDELAEI